MRWAILDTSVYINDWSRAAHHKTLGMIEKAFIVRHSSVVLSELRRGAITDHARRTVDALFALAKVQWAPAESDWWEAGRLIRAIGAANDWDARRRRDFQNDALIALTARRYGASVVTADTEDFGLLAGRVRIHVVAA
jgi:predicted nucleic acid-binding protein